MSVETSTLAHWFQRCLPGSAQGRMMLWPAFWQHDPASEHDPRAWIDSTLRFQEETGTALVKLTGPAHYQVADRGVEGSWQGAPLGERTFTRRAVHEHGDWGRLPTGLTSSEESVVRVAAAVRSRLAADVPLLATVFAPATQALMLAESTCFVAHAGSEPEVIRDALGQLAEQTAGLIRLFAQAGVDGIFLVSKHHDPNLVSDSLYARVIEESDRRVMRACDGFAANILHLHGPSVHGSGWPEQGRWVLHVEPPATALPWRWLRSRSTLPVLIALDYPAWESGRVAEPIRSGLAELDQRAAIVGSPCAVPLRYTRREIAGWVRQVRGQHVQCS